MTFELIPNETSARKPWRGLKWTYTDFENATASTSLDDIAEFIECKAYPFPARILANEYIERATVWAENGETLPEGAKDCTELDDILWNAIGAISEGRVEAERGRDEAAYLGDSDRYGN